MTNIIRGLGKFENIESIKFGTGLNEVKIWLYDFEEINFDSLLESVDLVKETDFDEGNNKVILTFRNSEKCELFVDLVSDIIY